MKSGCEPESSQKPIAGVRKSGFRRLFYEGAIDTRVNDLGQRRKGETGVSPASQRCARIKKGHRNQTQRIHLIGIRTGVYFMYPPYEGTRAYGIFPKIRIDPSGCHGRVGYYKICRSALPERICYREDCDVISSGKITWTSIFRQGRKVNVGTGVAQSNSRLNQQKLAACLSEIVRDQDDSLIS